MVGPTRTSESGRARNDEPQQQEKTPQKTTPSAFDEVLRQNRQPQNPQQQQSAQQGASTLQRQEVRERQQDSRDRSNQDRKSSSDESRSGESDSTQSEGPHEGRVEAKAQQRDREGGGQGQGQFGGGRGAMTREASQSKSKDSAKTAQAQTQGAFAAQLKKVDTPQALSAHHIQQIVNKVLQFFRLKKLTSGETEIELGFREEIFKGLRLRLVQKDGKVALHIQSGEGDVRRLFEKSRGAIEKALTDKGVKLSEIVISTE
jgi:hypothetical protein